MGAHTKISAFREKRTVCRSEVPSLLRLSVRIAVTPLSEFHREEQEVRSRRLAERRVCFSVLPLSLFGNENENAMLSCGCGLRVIALYHDVRKACLLQH